MGVRTIGQLATLSESVLTNKFGKGGELLYKYSRGLDDSPVSTEREEAKSVGNGFTFRHDLVKPEECRVGIDFLSDEIGRRLRAKGMKCATVQLTIKDEFLHSIQRQRSQNPPSDIAREIADTAYKILLDEWSDTRPIRMITVTASNLVHPEDLAEQIDMFAPTVNEDREKLKKREETIDKIRQKYGSESIINGAVIDSDIGLYHSKNKKHKE
jgi:DNA polymerase-4